MFKLALGMMVCFWTPIIFFRIYWWFRCKTKDKETNDI